MRWLIFMLSHNSASRIYNIGEDTRRTKKNIIIAGDSCVKRNIILHLHVVTKCNSGRYKNILTNVTILADGTTIHNVRKMPDASACAYYSTFINYTCRMNKIISTHLRKNSCKIRKHVFVVK